MIVRETEAGGGTGWQVVLQTDHADLSGQFVRRWGNERFDRPEPYTPVETASFRHDDGWSVWEQSPRLEAATNRPQNFLERELTVHLHLYRAAIAAVSEQDAYAGLLVALHGAGLYRGRYEERAEVLPGDGVLPEDPGEASVRELVDGFVREQEERQRRLVEQLHLDEDRLWTNYRLLQVFDRLSLYFCMNDILAGGRPERLEGVPVDYAGGQADVSVEPVGPWRVRLDPFPFAESPAHFTLRRRVVAAHDWPDDTSFRQDLLDTEPEIVEVLAESA